MIESFRKLFFFTCTRCKKEKRQSKDKAVAIIGLCKKCRYNKVAENQIPLFNLEAKS